MICRKWTSGNENNAGPGLPRGDNGHDGEDEFCHHKLNDGGDCENLKHREMHVVMNLCWFEPNSLNIHRRLGSYARKHKWNIMIKKCNKMPKYKKETQRAQI